MAKVLVHFEIRIPLVGFGSDISGFSAMQDIKTPRSHRQGTQEAWVLRHSACASPAVALAISRALFANFTGTDLAGHCPQMNMALSLRVGLRQGLKQSILLGKLGF